MAGRRSGKRRIAAAVAVHLALFVQHRLAKGERGMCLVIAGSVDQARMLFMTRAAEGYAVNFT